MSHPAHMVRDMTTDTATTLEALHALEQYKTTPRPVRDELRLVLAGYERARVLVERLDQTRRQTAGRIPELERAAGAALAETLRDHSAQRVPLELLQPVAEAAGEIDTLELELRLARHALRVADGRLLEPVEHWGRDNAARWAAQQRVALGPDSRAVPLAVSWVWAQCRPAPIRVPAQLVAGDYLAEVGGALSAYRRPDIAAGPVQRPPGRVLTPNGSEFSRLSAGAYRRALAGRRADWFALCCYAAGDIRSGPDGLETTADHSAAQLEAVS